MTKYEMVFILDARSSDAEKSTVSKRVVDVVEKCNGKLSDLSVWMEKQRFSFPMKKAFEGTYYLATLEIDGAAIDRLRRELRLNEKVLRVLIVDQKSNNKKSK